MSRPNPPDKYLSPVQGALFGIGAMLTSAVTVGAAHYRLTGKQLVEEGIDLRTRQRALPVATKALAVSSGICIAAGLSGVLIMQSLDLQKRNLARVSLPEALGLVQDQQDAVKRSFQDRFKQHSSWWHHDDTST